MKKILCSFLRFFIFTLTYAVLSGCGIFRAASGPESGLNVITPALLKSHIDFLASDSLKGRNSPSPGLDTAAEYIKRNLVKLGIEPLNGNFFQDFSLCTSDLGTDNYLKIISNGSSRSFTIKSDFIPFEITGNTSGEGDLVFAGYGITAPDLQYDDYKGIDVKDKIVLIFRHFPNEQDKRSVFNVSETGKYTSLAAKMKNAIAHGAKAVMLVTEPLNYATIRPRGFPWPSLSKTLPKDALTVSLCHEEQVNIPFVHVGEEVINLIIRDIDSLKRLQRRIDSTMQPMSFSLPGFRVSVKTSLKVNEMKVRNIAGCIRGSDPALRDEFLVLGAHYDHVGIKKDHKPDEDYIYNGADDNASGTSGVLSLAAAFSAMTEKSKRSVLFIFFAAEEKGLFGSAYYVDHPLVPLEKTVGMINLDMIARNSTDSLLLIGRDQSPDIYRIVKKQNKRIGFTFDYSMSLLLGGSDHYNFYRKDIPFIFFFSGLHADYHKVTDNPDKIDGIKAAKTARLAFRTAWFIANDQKHYRLIQAGPESIFQ